MNNLNTNLPDLSAFYSHKYVKVVEWKDLVLFHYTQECTYEKAWDDVTLNARGIIFNKKTGELVARPWKKFFNLGEMPCSRIEVLNGELFYALDKWDGSMGILFEYEGEYRVCTKGSFESEQAIWATAWAKEHVCFSAIKNDLTYVFEIIYLQNKIVVDYGDREGLVLTGVIRKEDGREELPAGLRLWASHLNVEHTADRLFKSLDDLAAYCKTLPSNQEGFVVTFPSTGLKVKVKGDEYLKIHKIISNLTPLSLWEAWDIKEKKIPALYLQQIPEEFRDFTDEMATVINKMHQDLYYKVEEEYRLITNVIWAEYTKTQLPQGIKEFAIECQKNHKENMSLLISIFKGQEDKLWENIHKRVRPTANVLPKGYNVKCDIYGRIKRVIDDTM